MEDVLKMIVQLEAESAARRKVLQYVSLSGHTLEKYHSHLKLNAEIIAELKVFL